jgi:23S rRNA pseudouridine955/2504/2580 synthase
MSSSSSVDESGLETAGHSRPAVKYLTVSEKNEDQRVDNFLLAQLKGVPKSKIYRVIRKGEVRINKKRCKPVSRLVVGDIVRVPPIYDVDEVKGPPNVSQSLVELLDTAILFENDQLLVINKPSGLAVHGGSGIRVGLIEALRSKYPATQFLELVHRLDRDTSGCILVAKSRAILRFLHAQFREDRVNKIYHLAVHGKWPGHRRKVDAPLKKNELKSGERIVVVHQDGKPSQTEFRVLANAPHFTLMEAKPATGRTHQIRVHASFTGCPIVGDDKYIPSSGFPLHGMEKSRLMLHAREIHFQLPEKNNMRFEAAYDAAFQKSLERMSLADFGAGD